MNAIEHLRLDVWSVSTERGVLASFLDESGASLIEFALIGSLILAVCLMLLLAVKSDG